MKSRTQESSDIVEVQLKDVQFEVSDKYTTLIDGDTPWAEGCYIEIEGQEYDIDPEYIVQEVCDLVSYNLPYDQGLYSVSCYVELAVDATYDVYYDSFLDEDDEYSEDIELDSDSVDIDFNTGKSSLSDLQYYRV